MGTSATSLCFHCGEAVPPGSRYSVVVGGEAQPMCCPGCQAVTETILSAGLSQYYRHRESWAVQAKAETDAVSDDSWSSLQDNPEIWGEALGEGRYRSSLVIEDMRCAACVWLIQTRLQQISGLKSIRLDLATGLAEMSWDSGRTSLARLLNGIQQLGYTPHLLSDAKSQRNWNQQQRRRQRQTLNRLLVAGLGMMQVMMYAVGLYAGEFEGISPTIERFLQGVSMLVATPVLLYSGQTFFIGAWRSLRSGRPGMDVPVVLALSLAYGFSVVHFLQGQGALYFDSVVMFVFFLLLTRFVEQRLRRRNQSLVQALSRLLPAMAQKYEAGETRSVPTHTLRPGDRISVAEGAHFPVDGVIIQGRSEVDESLLSGESRPLAKAPGDKVVAGSVNILQPLQLQVTACGDNTMLSGLSRLMLRAQSQRPKAALLADLVAGYFIIAVLLIAVVVGIVWWQLDSSRVLNVVLAVLVVTCPCALSLATPAALAAANRRLLRLGVAASGSQGIFAASAIDRVVFDKTGTLTERNIKITAIDWQPASRPYSQQDLLAIAAALEIQSHHPLASAFTAFGQTDIEAEELEVISGHGIRALVNGERFFIGRPAAAAISNGSGSDRGLELRDDEAVLARFTLSDTVRPDAEAMVAKLQRTGLSTQLLSGDSRLATQTVADKLEISDYSWRQTADNKLLHIRQLQSQGHKVLMVGDGVNDAPVLAAADVSIAVAGATQLASCSADFILTRDSLEQIPKLLQVARHCKAVVRQNMGWALSYNLLAIPFAAMGLIQPWMAVIGMSVSSLVVVLNAARVGRSVAPATPAHETGAGDLRRGPSSSFNSGQPEFP